MKEATQSWCSVTTYRDRVGREVGGGGSRDTYIYTPMADS